MKSQEFFTESNVIEIQDGIDNDFVFRLSDNLNTFNVIFEHEDKRSFAKFLKKAAEELELSFELSLRVKTGTD